MQRAPSGPTSSAAIRQSEAGVANSISKSTESPRMAGGTFKLPQQTLHVAVHQPAPQIPASTPAPPQPAATNQRTPKDANLQTLAEDILRSLGQPRKQMRLNPEFRMPTPKRPAESQAELDSAIDAAVNKRLRVDAPVPAPEPRVTKPPVQAVVAVPEPQPHPTFTAPIVEPVLAPQSLAHVTIISPLVQVAPVLSPTNPLPSASIIEIPDSPSPEPAPSTLPPLSSSPRTTSVESDEPAALRTPARSRTPFVDLASTSKPSAHRNRETKFIHWQAPAVGQAGPSYTTSSQPPPLPYSSNEPPIIAGEDAVVAANQPAATNPAPEMSPLLVLGERVTSVPERNPALETPVQPSAPMVWPQNRAYVLIPPAPLWVQEFKRWQQNHGKGKAEAEGGVGEGATRRSS
jgi:hypothetical protein